MWRQTLRAAFDHDVGLSAKRRWWPLPRKKDAEDFRLKINNDNKTMTAYEGIPASPMQLPNACYKTLWKLHFGNFFKNK